MYITNDHQTYYVGSEQHTSRGLFLMLLQEKGKPLTQDNLRAIVRKVALSQLGHFMMGYARIGGRSFVVSGAYGSDGLPMDVDSDTYNRGVPVPPELYTLWAHGGGWNSAGGETDTFRRWAKKNIDVLYNV